MSAGLAASTVTPGRTAPDVSRTTPAMDACACAATGTSTRQAIVNRIPFKARIRVPLLRSRGLFQRRGDSRDPDQGGQYTRSGVSRFDGTRAMLPRDDYTHARERDLHRRDRGGRRARTGTSTGADGCRRPIPRRGTGPDVRGRPLLAEAATESLGAWSRGGRVGGRAGSRVDGSSG